MPANVKKLLLILLASVVLGAAAYRLFHRDSTNSGAVDQGKLWDGRSTVRFKALASPEMVPVAKADFMQPGDYVLGVTVEGHSRAYPSTYIGYHHVVNDKVYSSSNIAHWFAVTYCDMCGTGIMFDTMLDGKRCELEFYGLYNGTIALCDKETGSVFLPSTGNFVTGPLERKSLKMGSLLDTTWLAWKRLHPDTLVMIPDGSDQQYYADNAKHVRSMDAFPMEFFAPTLTRSDNRLRPFERILGVTVNTQDSAGKPAALHRAYRLQSLMSSHGSIEDTIGGEPVTILFDSDAVSAVAVSPKLDGTLHHFEARKPASGVMEFYDRETGSRWTIEGRAESGPLAGKSLTRLESALSEWYAWAAFFPDTSIYDSSVQAGKPEVR